MVEKGGVSPAFSSKECFKNGMVIIIPVGDCKEHSGLITLESKTQISRELRDDAFKHALRMWGMEIQPPITVSYCPYANTTVASLC